LIFFASENDAAKETATADAAENAVWLAVQELSSDLIDHGAVALPKEGMIVSGDKDAGRRVKCVCGDRQEEKTDAFLS
jgi:hypothetical protein